MSVQGQVRATWWQGAHRRRAATAGTHRQRMYGFERPLDAVATSVTTRHMCTRALYSLRRRPQGQTPTRQAVRPPLNVVVCVGALHAVPPPSVTSAVRVAASHRRVRARETESGGLDVWMWAAAGPSLSRREIAWFSMCMVCRRCAGLVVSNVTVVVGCVLRDLCVCVAS